MALLEKVAPTTCSPSCAKVLSDSWYCDIDGRKTIFAMAPMVGQSDLPFRMLCRKHGATVIYSEMFIASRFATDDNYRKQAFGSGIRPIDHPIVVQFAANDPTDFLGAVLMAQRMGADAVDLNLGCPQRRARENHYGSYLTDPEDWLLCAEIIRAATSHAEVTIPITVKIRLQPTDEATVEFAQLLASAGASLVAVHGRQRGSEERRRDGSADLEAVAKVVRALAPLPVLSNGNVRCVSDVSANLQETNAAGIMVAEHLLKDPALFARVSTEHPIKIKELALDYLRLVHALDKSEAETGGDVRLMAEDGSVQAKDGQMIRAEVDPEKDFERYSVWWTNTRVVKSHLTSMLGESNTVISRNTFKKAPTTSAVSNCLFKRLASATSSASTASATSILAATSTDS